MGTGIQGFKPRKLVQVREARGFTQTALAESLRVTRAAVSQYENGQRSPSREVLVRLAYVLRVPTHYFVQDDVLEVSNTIFFRSMASATRQLRTQARRRFEWLVRIVRHLEQYIEFPTVQIPDLQVPTDPRTLVSEDIEELADATRVAMGLGTGPISNVTWLLENNGAIISCFGLSSRSLEAFSNFHDGTPFLVVNRDKGTSVRWRYDLAHELGHMILHRKVGSEALEDKSLFRHIEDQAHYFAGAFLLPRDSFGRMLPYSVTLDTLAAVKSKWKVSVAAMVMRLQQLGLISGKKKQRLFMSISRRGWRVREPLDDTLPTEEPQVLRRAAELLMAQNIARPRDLEASLGISRSDIEALLGCKDSSEEGVIRLHQNLRKGEG